MRKILLPLAAIVFAGGLIAGGTGAFFSDSETSTANVFTAGAIDLTVDSQAHYNGHVCVAGLWQDDSSAVHGPYPVNGTACGGTWDQTDLGPTNKFFDYGDLKPGDTGENTISLHVENNDAYACAIIDSLVDDDNGLTEPEAESGDATGGAGQGELSTELHFFAWGDDGDNVWESGELPLFSNIEGPASDVLGGHSYLLTPLATPLPANTTRYIGLYWCYGAITVGTNTLSCSGSAVTNKTQTDSMKANITFYVEQSRNNPNFTCPNPGTVSDNVTSIQANNLETSSLVAAKSSDKWFFYNDTNDTIMTINQFSGAGGVNNIVAGPGPEGAAQMTLDTGVNPRYNIATYRYNDVKLSDISSLKYRIYDTDPTNGTPYLHFNVDFNNSDTWQRRLVQVPTGLVANTWTVIDALAGSWTYSGTFWPAGVVDNTGTTPGTTPRTWAQILANYPNAETRSTDSWLGVRVGQPGPAGDTGYVDWIEFNGEVSDFE